MAVNGNKKQGKASPRDRRAGSLLDALLQMEHRIDDLTVDEAVKVVQKLKSRDNLALNGVSSSTGLNAVHWAVLNHKNNILEALLIENAWRSHVLHAAVEVKNHEAIKLLTQYGAYVEYQDEHQPLSPLMSAVKSQWTEGVHALLLAGADASRQSRDGYTALMIAAENNYVEGINLLMRVRRGADEDTALALKRELLEYKDMRGQTALSKAVLAEHSGAVRSLVDHGSDVNTKDKKLRTPLFYATIKNNPLLVKFLLRRGAEPDTRSTGAVTPLGHAAKNGFGSCAVELLRGHAGIDYASRGAPALVYAVREGHESIAQMLLKSGADSNSVHRVHDSHTALIYAVKRGSFNLVKMLLDANADPNIPNSHGWTPLMYATAALGAERSRNWSECYLLLEEYLSTKGGLSVLANDIEHKWLSDWIADQATAYRSGKLSRQEERLLERLGIDLDDNVIYRQTPRELDTNALAIVQLLIDRGADPGLKNDSNTSALDIVKRFNDLELTRYYTKSANLLRIRQEYGEDAERMISDALYSDIGSGLSFLDKIGSVEVDTSFVSKKRERDATVEIESQAKRIEEGKRAFYDVFFDTAGYGLPLVPILGNSDILPGLSHADMGVVLALSSISIAKFFMGTNRETAEKIIDFIDDTCIKIDFAISDTLHAVEKSVRELFTKISSGLKRIKDIALATFGCKKDVQDAVRNADRELSDPEVVRSISTLDYDSIAEMGVEDLSLRMSEDYRTLFSDDSVKTHRAFNDPDSGIVTRKRAREREDQSLSL